MSGKLIRTGLLAIVSLSPVTVLVDPCEAGPILDWLLGRRRVAYFGGANACTPQTQVARRVVVNYAPQTRYRNRWMRVPVTVYRPTTTVDPVSGCPVTCMRPCTSYRWQVQRVAVTVMRPVYSTVLTNPCAVPANCNGCAPTAAATTSGEYYNRAVPPAETRPSLPMREGNGGAKTNGGSKANGAATQRSLLKNSRFAFPRRQLRPIPDPAPKRTLEMTPNLIKPRDRTAVYYPVRRAWAHTTIKWDEVSGSKRLIQPAQLRSVEARPLQQRNVRRLDDRGWRGE